MKIRVLSSREEINYLSPLERIIHVAFRPSNKDIFAIVEACPKVQVIQLPKSYMKSVSKAIQIFLNMQRITLLEGDVWGHRKDINEHRAIPDQAITELNTLKAEGESVENIVHRVVRKYRLSPGLIKYLVESGATV